MSLVVYWLMCFLPIILIKIAFVRLRKLGRIRDSMVFTEAIGLLLTFLQPIVFIKAVLNYDLLGALLIKLII